MHPNYVACRIQLGDGRLYLPGLGSTIDVEIAARVRGHAIGDETAELRWFRHPELVPSRIELRNIATVAELIVSCAATRHESRGLHSTIDYPETSPRFLADTVVKRGVVPHLRGR